MPRPFHPQQDIAAQNSFKKTLSSRCEASTAGKARSPAADHVRRRSPLRADEPAPSLLGSGRFPAQGGLPTHPRIHLFVWRGCSQGRHLRLSHHADIQHGVLPGVPRCAVAQFSRQDILLALDGAPNHRSGQLPVPDNISLLFLPPYSPELNPKENLWDEIREKIFKNYALKSIDHVRQKLARSNPLHGAQR